MTKNQLFVRSPPVRTLLQDVDSIEEMLYDLHALTFMIFYAMPE